MVVAEETSIKGLIVDWMGQEMEGGGELPEAAKKVLSRITSTGQSAVFIEQLGLLVIQDIWREHNRQERLAAREGQRRIDPASMNEEHSLLDALHKVGDRYVRMGDMDAKMCRETQRFYSKQAMGNLKEAHMFSRVADNLGAGETVSSKFTDDQLRSLREEFVVE